MHTIQTIKCHLGKSRLSFHVAGIVVTNWMQIRHRHGFYPCYTADRAVIPKPFLISPVPVSGRQRLEGGSKFSRFRIPLHFPIDATAMYPSESSLLTRCNFILIHVSNLHTSRSSHSSQSSSSTADRPHSSSPHRC